MPYVARFDFLGLLDLWIADLPRVRDWWARVQTWPSFRAGIVDPMIPHGPTIRADLSDTLAVLRAATQELAA